MVSAPSCRRIALVFPLAAALSLTAADWPQWRGPSRTGRVPQGSPVIARIPVAPRSIWKVPAGDGFSSPVVASGRVFAMDAQDGKEVLRALDASNGRELWRAEVDETFRDSQGPPAPRCTPVASGDRVYAQSCRGELACFSANDGRRLWSLNYTRDFGAVFTGEKGNAPGATRHGNNGAPWVEGNTVWASAGSTQGAGVVAIDAATGKVRWKSANEVAAYAAPMVASLHGTRQVVHFMADAALGLDAGNGQVLWRHPMKTAFARHVMTPVIQGDRVLVGSHQTGLIALDPQPGPQGWTVREAWKNADAAPNFSCPVAVGQRVIGLGPQGNVVCIDANSGATRWTQSGWFTTSAEKAHAGFVVLANDTLLVLTDSGELIHFQDEGGACRELGRAQVCGANWCNPALVGTRLFLRDGMKSGGTWRCIELAAD